MDKDKRISVDEFIKKYNQFTSDKLKENYINSVVHGEYMPYEKKNVIAENIARVTYYTKIKDNDGNIREKLHIDSVKNYMFYCLSLVDNYTYIKIDFNDVLSEFNKLNALINSEYGIIDVLISAIPKREVEEFKMILDLVCGDIIKNEYETHAFISSQVERFGQLAGIAITPMIEQLIDTINNLDESKIDKITNNITKFIKK